MSKISIYLVDDWVDSLALMSLELQNEGFDIETFSSAAEFMERIKSKKPDIALVDVNMPEISGLDLLKKMPLISPETPVIMMTGVNDNLTNIAVNSIKNHAVDFIEKTEPIDSIINKIIKATEAKQKQENLKYTAEEIFDKFGFVGASGPIQALCKKIEQIAPTQHPVLLIGETGTGKELAARALHKLSHRSSEIFLPVNYSTIVDSLAESELFGHKKGAFTGANKDKEGLFKLAEKGTLFLDEISEANPQLQAKLLRALDPGEFAPVGGTPQPVKARLIAATNKDLSKEDNDSFRRDLFFRLEFGTLKIPPLRERREDIPILIDFFLNQEKNLNPNIQRKEFSEDSVNYLKSMTWKGNIRELKGFIKKALLFIDKDEITASDLISLFYDTGKEEEASPEKNINDFINKNKKYIDEVGADKFINTVKISLFEFYLNLYDNNKTKAAEAIRMEKSTFRKALSKLENY